MIDYLTKKWTKSLILYPRRQNTWNNAFFFLLAWAGDSDFYNRNNTNKFTSVQLPASDSLTNQLLKYNITFGDEISCCRYTILWKCYRMRTMLAMRIFLRLLSRHLSPATVWQTIVACYCLADNCHLPLFSNQSSPATVCQTIACHCMTIVACDCLAEECCLRIFIRQVLPANIHHTSAAWWHLVALTQ